MPPLLRSHVLKSLLLLVLANAVPARAQVIYTDTQVDSTPRTTTAESPLTLTIDSGTATQSGAITGDGSITKTGDGTLRLTTSSNPYSGGTTISAGTLGIVSSNGAGTGAIAISSGATLDLGTQNMGLAGGLANRISGPGTVSTSGAFNFSNNAILTRSFGLGGSATLNHTGTGTLTLTAANTHSGATSVSTGTLQIDGSITNSAVTVQSTGTLTGTGTVAQLTLAGTLAPGRVPTSEAPERLPGTFGAGNTTFAESSRFKFEVDNASGSAGTNWDKLAITGSLTLAATSANPVILELTSLTLANAAGLTANFNQASNYAFTFVTTTTGITGFAADKFSVNTSAFSNPFSGSWAVTQTNGGNDLSLTYTGTAAIPEPSTYAAIFGVLALASAAWRKRRA